MFGVSSSNFGTSCYAIICGASFGFYSVEVPPRPDSSSLELLEPDSESEDGLADFFPKKS